MSIEQNKAVVRRFVETGLTKWDNALADELLAPDYVNHLLPGGREGFKQMQAMMTAALPDLKVDYRVEHLIAEGDLVAARLTYHVTNDGKEATASVLSEYRLANGKIVEDWPPDNALEMLQQVGVSLPTGWGGQ